MNVRHGATLIEEPGPLDRARGPDHDMCLVGAVLDDDPVLPALGIRIRVDRLPDVGDERRQRIGRAARHWIEEGEGSRVARGQAPEDLARLLLGELDAIRAGAHVGRAAQDPLEDRRRSTLQSLGDRPIAGREEAGRQLRTRWVPTGCLARRRFVMRGDELHDWLPRRPADGSI